MMNEKDSKAVGVLTFHHTGNYGGSLQAYGLVCELNRLNIPAELVDYRPWKTHALLFFRALRIDRWYKRARRGGCTMFESILTAIDDSEDQIKKILRANDWLQSHGVLSNEICRTRSALRRVLRRYDTAIVGSDEVWKCNINGRNDLTFFLDLADEKLRRISYAASVGGGGGFQDRSDEISVLLNQFYALSVRDAKTLNEVQKLTDQKVSTVCDPSFYLKDWIISVGSHSCSQTKYAVMAGGYSQKYGELIAEFCKARKLTLISLGDGSHASKDCRISLNQTEWISMLAGAEIVFTSLFHGTIFSLMLNRKLVVFSSPSKANKLSELLQPIGLEGLILKRHECAEIEKILNIEIAYNAVHSYWDSQVKSSRNWLLSVLKPDDVEIDHK